MIAVGALKMAKKPKIDVAKLVDNLKIDSKIAEDLARGAIAEPEKMAEATQAMLKNASPLYWFSLQQRFAQEHLSLMARLFVPTAGADTTGSTLCCAGMGTTSMVPLA
jgi:hypothetical protein